MKFVYSAVIGLLLASLALGQTSDKPANYKGWDLSSEINLTQTQNAYSDNWDGEEVGSVSWAFNLNFLAVKQFNDRVNNRNNLKLSYGQTHNQRKEENAWLEPVKSTDKIDFESVVRFTYGGFIDPFVAGRFQSNFVDTRKDDETEYINPATVTESFGAARMIWDEGKRNWIVRLGFGIRQQMDRIAVKDDVTGRRGWRGTNDGGLELVSDLATPIVPERLRVSSKLTVFQALFFSQAKQLKGTTKGDYWKSPDVNWETTFTANITKYVMVNLYTQLLYDKQINRAGRFKETLSLGLTYTLI